MSPGQPRPPQQGDAVVELCAFRVGDEEYVLDLRRIREILLPLPITPLPSAPGFVEGVINVRGEVVPVVDVRRRLGLAPRAGGRGRVLLTHVAGRLLALLVDAVVEVVRLPRSAIGPAPLLASGPRLFLGVCGARDSRPLPSRGGAARPGSRRIRLLLNVKALLEGEPPGATAPAPEDATGVEPTGYDAGERSCPT